MHVHLLNGFQKAVEKYPLNTALEVGDKHLSYLELSQRAASYRAVLENYSVHPAPFIGLLANRSVVAYAGLVAILASGKAYFPLPLEQPTDRLLHMIENSETQTFIVGNESLDVLSLLLARIERPSLFFLPEHTDVSFLQKRFPTHRFIGRPGASAPIRTVTANENGIAYLIFTSGSTGTPKGIVASHKNAVSYIESALNEFEYYPNERVSLTFDLSFDPSVHDIFTTWYRGATLVVLPRRELLFNDRFIIEKKLTSWYSVPLQIYALSKRGVLTPNCFPLLRRSVFVGEPLPVAWAEDWAKAAPNSSIINVYGPTETTVTLTKYEWTQNRSSAQMPTDVVPIGKVFSNHEYLIVEDELWLSGPQVTEGYFNDPALTAKKFPVIDGKRWYKTGDLVTQDKDFNLHFKGRVDQQFKISGFRVEVEEIHRTLKEATGAKQVISLPWPVNDGIVQGITSFVFEPKSDFNEEAVKSYCKQKLPYYMIPRRILKWDAPPLNPNGKVDRSKLLDSLKGGDVLDA